jgi:transcriptional repressor NrdR|tara:strand:- start:1058 stop:1498 length:441 start_codon:yes stop_codon:yes gene_type:complete
MQCPYCFNQDLKVLESRDSSDSIRRRRECLKCSKRFTTYEKIAIDLMVIKKDGKKEPFNIDKLKKGVALALEKRPFNEEDVSIIASSIEKELKKLRNHVINTRIIGNKVIRKLKLLDQVAYLRFASIYKDFEKIDDFEEELKILTK